MNEAVADGCFWATREEERLLMTGRTGKENAHGARTFRAEGWQVVRHGPGVGDGVVV